MKYDCFQQAFDNADIALFANKKNARQERRTILIPQMP